MFRSRPVLGAPLSPLRTISDVRSVSPVSGVHRHELRALREKVLGALRRTASRTLSLGRRRLRTSDSGWHTRGQKIPRDNAPPVSLNKRPDEGRAPTDHRHPHRAPCGPDVSAPSSHPHRFAYFRVRRRNARPVNKAFAITTDDGRPYRLVRVAALAAAIFGLFWLGVVLLFPAPDLARAAQQAAELQAIIRQQTQYSEVRVNSLTNGELFVSAPDALAPAAKSELERLVVQHSPQRDTPVSYLVPIPEVITANPK